MCFGGRQLRFSHTSDTLKCTMNAAIYLPPVAASQPVPCLYWLSGLTCNEENFIHKAGAQRLAAELGIAIVCPDTSPRGTQIAHEHDSYDLGSGAGFYVNATQAPWSEHYNMYDYVLKELPDVIETHFPISSQKSISGHSMGGHGALTIALKNPKEYCSVSAFSPICNPSVVAWGEKAFSAYLGNDKNTWKEYDSCELIKGCRNKIPLFIDQGEQDEFLHTELHPQSLENICREYKYPLTLRYQSGYDHSYYFIASFIADHLNYHTQALTRQSR